MTDKDPDGWNIPLAPDPLEPELWAPEMWEFTRGLFDVPPDNEMLFEDASGCPIHVRLAWMVNTKGGPS